MASTAQQMAAIGALQIKDAGTDGKYAQRKRTFGSWATTMVRPTLFKMRGFNASTGQFEYWLALNPNQGPPNGDIVSNTVIADVYMDSFPPIV